MMNTAMILCAGFGTRMKGFTENCPKPMLVLNGKPLLEYTITHLKKLGISNIIINLHYLHEMITSYFEDGHRWGVTIRYSYEDTPLGTAGAVKKVQRMLESENDFLVLYGDVVTNYNFRRLIDFHKRQTSSTGTILLHERVKSNSIVEIDDNFLVTRFWERPLNDPAEKRQNWVNSGLYCFNKKIFKYLKEENIYCDFPKEIFSLLVGEKSLFGLPIGSAYRCAVDSPERFARLTEDFNNNTFHIN
ncbi:MAG: nucleotidyltransferase family protein [Oligoflexales bacterium]|nr:nucleotidyltransferase family protein [Oligoflexales bacterium]